VTETNKSEKKCHLNKNNSHCFTATLLETIQQYSSTAVGSFERTLDTALHDAGTGQTPFFFL